jgi:predicted enzyme related to lactoylglutathione lyase
MTRDAEAAKTYYAKICGWSYDAMKMDGGQDYYVAMSAGIPVAGIMDMSGMAVFEELPPHWFTYFAVDDVDAAARQTKEQGGEVVRPPFDVPGIGRIAILKDSSGAAMGMITEAEQA